jgi:asparagine synthase (glutamine-hydrolysing)
LSETIRNNYPKIDRFDAALFVELKTRLPNYILHRTDRTSMKNSVEARVPFLDRAFAESALSCPPLLKTFGFREKSVLRKAFNDILPKHFKSLRKFGYNAPNQWCWSPQAKNLVDQYLSSSALSSSGLFNVKEIETRIKNVQQAADNKSWDLETLEDASFITGIMSTQILFDGLFKESTTAA